MEEVYRRAVLRDPETIRLNALFFLKKKEGLTVDMWFNEGVSTFAPIVQAETFTSWL